MEQITKAFTYTNANLLEESKSTTKATEKLNKSNFHVKYLEILHENGFVDTGLTSLLVNLRDPKI